jgi:hypothetical protein
MCAATMKGKTCALPHNQLVADLVVEMMRTKKSNKILYRRSVHVGMVIGSYHVRYVINML